MALSLFDILPVCVAAASGSRGWTNGVIAAATATWMAAELASRSYDATTIFVWNGAVRCGVLGVTANLVGLLVDGLHHERVRSRRDGLTGLLNRQGFRESLEVLLGIGSAVRSTVLYIDVDDCKQVNDRFGHGLGDEILAATGEVLVSGLRSGDLAARVGGDEFAVVLSGADDGSVATSLVERLHGQLHRMADERGWPVGFSIGVTTGAGGQESVDASLHRADQAMYEGKRSGKGRIVSR